MIDSHEQTRRLFFAKGMLLADSGGDGQLTWHGIDRLPCLPDLPPLASPPPFSGSAEARDD